jgi:hypothetical protein
MLDDRGLLPSSSRWTRGTSTSYAYSTYSRSSTAGISLSRSGVRGRRVAIVVTTCRTCGSVDVYHAGIKLGRISTYSSSTRTRQVKWLPLQSATRTGTVVIRTTGVASTYIDGIATLH